MAVGKGTIPAEEATISGFATVDDKGRVSLPKSARQALHLEPGTPVAYVVLNGTLLFVSQAEHLAELTRQAEQALKSAGLTVQDFLAELPAAREAVFVETYGSEFVQELARQHAEQRERAADN